ncbi:MAG: hypothetical protein AB7F88_16465 [Pyrinomonadaceae bacterium]
MEFAKLLSEDRSRATTQAIVDYIGDDRERFAALVAVFDGGDRRMKQRSAWPISVVAEKHPELLVPHLGKLVAYLPRNDVHNAVKRSVTRLLQFVEVPKRLQGKVFSHCIDLIADPGEWIAVRCFAMTAAERIAISQPSLMKELRLVVENQMEHATAGMKVRIRRLVSEK